MFFCILWGMEMSVFALTYLLQLLFMHVNKRPCFRSGKCSAFVDIIAAPKATLSTNLMRLLSIIAQMNTEKKKKKKHTCTFLLSKFSFFVSQMFH